MSQSILSMLSKIALKLPELAGCLRKKPTCYHKPLSLAVPHGCPMNLRRVRMKARFACLLLVLTCRGTEASTTLLRTTSKTSPEWGSLQTYAGKIDPVISSVKPATSITVVLLTDSLSPAEIESVKKDLLGLYTSLHGHAFRLGVLGHGAFGIAGPFASRAQLKSALNEVAGGSDSST